MRLPWDRTKPPQLDLLSGEAVPNAIAAEFERRDAEVAPEVPATPVPLDAIEALDPPMTTHDEPRRVPLSSLCEDPANPRTEFPPDELQELAEDIRQHGILQPIVVHPVDEVGRFRIHFGAKRFRAAAIAGLTDVPVVVRRAEADPYAQVAENQKRHGLTPLDVARFIRSRVDLGEANAAIARRLGMDLTTVAHHLALLELPPALDAALRSGRCAAPRTLYELSKVHAERPQAVEDLLKGDQPVTREAVAALRPPARKKKAAAKKPAARLKPARHSASKELATRAERLCTQLAATCAQLRSGGFEQVPPGQLTALRERLGNLKLLLEP